MQVLGKNAIHRLYVAGHGGAPEWLRTEGIVWLNGHHLANNKRLAFATITARRN